MKTYSYHIKLVFSEGSARTTRVWEFAQRPLYSDEYDFCTDLVYSTQVGDLCYYRHGIRQ